MSKRLLVLFSLIAGSATLLPAQARPTATRTGDLQVGAGFVSANADTTYDTGRFNGVFGYADFDFRQHFGVDFEVHQIYSPSIDEVHERTYEIGPRYFRTYGRLVPFAKGMYGRGVFNYPGNEANLAYNLYAGAVGADYKATRYLNLRAEFEYQHWLSFPISSLSPTLFSVGAAYHFK